jgi:hypothetical protein
LFVAFGANPADAVAWSLRSPSPWKDEQPVVQIARSRDWLVAIEQNIPPQGVRQEVLRRASAKAEVVSIYHDIGKLNHELGHAVEGSIVSGVVTTVPPHWYGSDPGRLRATARELGLGAGQAAVGGYSEIQILLTLAEHEFGLSLDPVDLEGAWPATPILPVLADLAHTLPTGSPPWIGDTIIDLKLSRITPEALLTVMSLRARRLMAETDLDQQHGVTEAVGVSLAQGHLDIDDDGPIGLRLRKLTLEGKQAERALESGDHATLVGVRQAVRRGEAVSVLRLLLSGRQVEALAADLQFQRRWHPATWRDQALTDLAQVHVPVGDSESTEPAANILNRDFGPSGITDAEPVRRHVQHLVDMGVDVGEIARYAEMTPVGLDLLLSGRVAKLSRRHARMLLAIRPI